VRSIASRLSYANVVSTFCLFVLLGGGAYAATNLPRNSVGTKQLKGGAVTGVKIKDGTITGTKVDSRTLGVVPAALRADSALTANRATSAGSADRATEATHADRAATADNALLLEGNSARSFVSSSQVGYIDETFSGCTLAVQCARNSLTIAGVTFRSICEYNAGIGAVVIRVTGGSRTGYGYAIRGTEARNGYFEGDGNVGTAASTGVEAVAATGSIMVRTPARIISLNFDASARIPTVGSAACTVYATALAV
jgi:hypothetical protein